MSFLKTVSESLLHFLFPHICSGCGTDIVNKESQLCLRCIHELPSTNFSSLADNPIEKKFWGRIPVTCGMAQYYFTPQSLLQRLMH
jgi:hypothetical protein